MPRVKILQISHKPTKSGKGIICGIKTTDKNGQEVWINGWGNDTTKGWSIGQEIELDIFQEEYNGTLRLKFKDVKQRNVFEELDKISAMLQTLLARGVVKDQTVTETLKELAKDFGGEVVEQKKEIKVEEIPF